MFCLQRGLGSVGIGWFCSEQGPWTKAQQQGLLGPFAIVETKDAGPGTPDHGPRVSDTGALVLGA